MPDRRPPLALVTPGATAEEAAAIVAALERFRLDTTPPAAPASPPGPVGGWLRAARREAVRRAPDDPGP